MPIKVVKARKSHKCDHCGEMIQPGESYNLRERRIPVYGSPDPDWPHDEGPQAGIEFFRSRSHVHRCDLPEACKKGCHKWVYSGTDANEWHGPTFEPYEYCEECGTQK